MDELKKKLLALDPKQKFLLTAGGGILVAVLYLILPQVSVLGFASVMGIKCFTADSSLLLIMSLAIVILPIVSACMINSKKVVTPLFAYITTGVFLLFGILLGTTFPVVGLRLVAYAHRGHRMVRCMCFAQRRRS